MIIYGGKYACLVKVVKDQIEIVCTIGPFYDWIMDIKWIKHNSQSWVLGVILAHNSFEVWSVPLESGTRRIIPTKSPDIVSEGFLDSTAIFIEEYRCSEYCILYSAYIYGNNIDDIRLISGTVFHENLVWSPNGNFNKNCVPIERRLIGHEGVIFKIKAYKITSDCLKIISVSDDRTIRLWNVEFSVNSARSSQKVVPSCGQLFGHEARVWDFEYVQEKNLVVSVGEDRTCRIWNLIDYEQIGSLAGFSGKGIWCCAISPLSDKVLVGGNDSGIREYSLNQIEKEKEIYSLSLKSGIPRSICQLDGHSVLVAADNGWLIVVEERVEFKLKHFVVSNNCILKCLNYENKQHIVCMTDNNNSMNYLSVWKSQGTWNTINLGCHEVKEQQIRNVQMMKNYNSDELIDVIIHRNPDKNSQEGSSLWYRIKLLPEFSISMISRIDYVGDDKPQNMKHLVSSINHVDLFYHEENKASVFCAQPNGLLVHYLWTSHGGVSKLELTDKIQATLKRSQLSFLKIRKKSELTLGVWTCGYDGHVGDFQVTASTGDWSKANIDPISHVFITKGRIEKFEIIDGNFYLFCFLYRNFFCVEYESRNLMFNFDFPNRSKQWDIVKSQAKDYSIMYFTCLNSRKLFMFSKVARNHADNAAENWRISPGNGMTYHGRETRCLKFINSFSTSNSLVFATGGEDGFFRIQSFEYQSSTFVNITAMKKHTCFISTIAFAESHEHKGSILMFTAGGREEMICWKLSKKPGKPLDLDISEQSSCFPISDIPDTRIMDVSICDASCLNVQFAKLGLFIVINIYSDGKLRAWVYDEVLRKYYIIGKFQVSVRCPQSVSYLISPRTEDNQSLWILTTATDGVIRSFNVTSDIESFLSNYVSLRKKVKPVKVITTVNALTGKKERIQDGYDKTLTYSESFLLNVHQSGITGFDMCKTNNANIYTAITCGDDNSICMSQIDVNAGAIKRIYSLKKAHSSTITFIKWTNYPSTFISISSDQRINTWRLTQQSAKTPNTDPLFELVESRIVDVSDPMALDVANSINQKTLIAITGVGCQIFEDS